MNNQRRKSIAALRKRIEEVNTQIGAAIQMFEKISFDEFKDEVEGIRDEEQEYYDNMPEGLQGGDKGSAAEEAVGFLDSAIEALGEAQEHINELEDNFGKVDEAIDALADAESVG